MTLIDAVAGATGLDVPKSEITAGAILGALRMSMPTETFTPIARAIPDYQQLILKSGTVVGGGRTGEIVAMVSELRTNAGVLKLAGQLGRAGVNPQQVGRAAKAVIDFVILSQGSAAVKPLLDTLPGFRELVQ